MSDLENTLKRELKTIGLTEDFNLCIRGYSKSFYGRYDPNTNTIVIYVLKNQRGEMFSFDELMYTLIHEAIHCKQWHSPHFVRYKGVMHDSDFKFQYKKYTDIFRARKLMKEVKCSA